MNRDFPNSQYSIDQDNFNYKSSVARGYFSDPFGASLSNLPTAGVCEQREGMSISNLPTAGACDQHVGVALSNLPTAGVCDQRVLDLLIVYRVALGPGSFANYHGSCLRF